MANKKYDHEHDGSQSTIGSGDYMPARHSQYGSRTDPHPNGANENYGLRRENADSHDGGGGSGHYASSTRFTPQHAVTEARHASGEVSGHPDPDYHKWRNEQIDSLDRDYGEWRKERYDKFAADFDKWRMTRTNREQTRTVASTGASDAEAEKIQGSLR